MFPELRTDVLTGQQVIIAPQRFERPFASMPDVPLSRLDDPFREGNESETPSERFAVRDPASVANGPGWTLRVVPNRFPAVVPQSTSADGIIVPAETPAAERNLFPCEPAIGEHDVVIECPDARTRLVELSDDEITQVLHAWQMRLVQLTATGRYTSVAVFRNEGFSAGASLAHCHSQIIASKQLTPLDAQRHQRAAQHKALTGRDLVEDLRQQEWAVQHRIVAAGNHFIVLCPFASRTSWHVRFVPREASMKGFADASMGVLAELASSLKTVMETIEAAIGGPFSFNLILLHPRLDQPPVYQWMLDLLPRTGRIAGWEFHSGIDIATVSPERAAEVLRGLIGRRGALQVPARPVQTSGDL